MNNSRNSHKKICIVTPEFPPNNRGGLARTVQRVSAHARDLGMDVHVALFEIAATPLVLLDENEEISSVDGITLHRMTVGREQITDAARDIWECPHTSTLRMMYQSLEKLLKTHGFDLFHSFFLYPVGYVTGLIAKRFRIPSIVTVVGNDVKKYIFSPEKVGTAAIGLRNADMVVGLSQDLLDMADSVEPMIDKSRLIYNSVEIPDRAWTAREPGAGPFRIGCGGIFKYAKGLPYLFKAVARIRSGADVELELIGELRESEKQMYEHMVGETNIGDILRFRGRLSHASVPEWMLTLDAFVLPSVSEGCPNILMEALAAGVPSIATRTGACDVLIKNGESGILVPWGDSESIATALQQIIDSPDRGASMAAAARAGMRRFSPARERSAWKDLYDQAVES